RRRHTSSKRDWSSDVCSSDLKKSLAGLEDAKSGLSDEKIDAITRRNQFVADYNDYHRLSFNGKTNTEDFRLEMREFIKTYPEERSEERRVGKEWRARMWRAAW